MFEPIRQIFRTKKKASYAPRTPDGERYYIVGDIHGRFDLLERLAEAIELDDAECEQARSTVVLLGDLVDRGPASAAVVDFARTWQKRRSVRILAGNHEEMFLESFTDMEVLRHFLKYGGRETLLSYGIERKAYNAMTLEELFERIQTLVPQEDRDFIASFEELIVAGDYVFVHAGIDPERAIEDQKRRDNLWIRERFLRHEGPLSHVIVHGHTIFDEVEIRKWRIGIDTGAYDSGRLTALVLDGETRRLIAACETDDSIAVEKGEILA